MVKNTRMAVITGAIIAAATVAGIVAYASSAGTVRTDEPVKPGAKTQFITLGTVGEDAEKQARLLQPTADYIASKLSTKDNQYSGKVVIARNTGDMVSLLKDRKVDLYFDGPLAATLVGREAGSVQFLVRWKEGVESYRTVFIARNDSPIETLDDLAGKTIAFEGPGSTSGFLLPRAYLIQNGLAVAEKGSEHDGNAVTYSFTGGNDSTYVWVVEGRADAGASSNIELGQAPLGIRSQLKVIESTFEVAQYTVSYRPDMNPVLVQELKQILLDMNNDRKGMEILKNYESTSKYTIISERDPLITNMSSLLGLLG